MLGGSVDIWDLYYSDITNSFNIGEDGTDYFTIRSGGNIGIGTSTPSEKLEIYGNGASIKLNATNAESLYSLKFTSNYDYSNKFTIESGNTVVMQEKKIIDVGGTGNSNSKLFLSNYYGIGFSTTTNPVSKEEIQDLNYPKIIIDKEHDKLFDALHTVDWKTKHQITDSFVFWLAYLPRHTYCYITKRYYCTQTN